VGLPGLIEALLEPRAYPERPEKVVFQQTHISYLFFTPRHVYKVKKPVDFEFLDFSTLKKRLHFCQEEVRLNRRLAPGVYLDVVAITAGKAGKEGVFMEGEGEAIEYAVKMKRLPAETMLEAMLEGDIVTGEIIERVAEAVAAFHKKAETNERISSFGLPKNVKNNTDENFAQTKDFIGRTITRKQYDDIRAYTDAFLSSNNGEFNERVQKGFIKDCHGDIHSEHISISDGIQIYDCIEFNERFRYSDIVADSAFLSMDLDFHNRHDLLYRGQRRKKAPRFLQVLPRLCKGQGRGFQVRGARGDRDRQTRGRIKGEAVFSPRTPLCNRRLQAHDARFTRPFWYGEDHYCKRAFPKDRFCRTLLRCDKKGAFRNKTRRAQVRAL
jgi:aminoglycoside phosphotransferase family enzyme